MTMQTALYKSQEYDVFIVDEADQCILELGSTIDTAKQIVSGYWDILTKRSILLTATISKDLEDILFEVFGFKTPAQLDFDNYMNDNGASSCKADI